MLDLCARAGISIDGARVEAVEVAPGRGIRGRVDGAVVVVGTEDWLASQGEGFAAGDGQPDGLNAAPRHLSAPDERQDEAESVIHCAIEGQVTLALTTEDRLRPRAAEVIARMRERGLRVTMLTGDRLEVARRIAAALGAIEIIADVLPEAKDRVIAALQADGHRVAMVGDGVNDAPALVRADVGIAMGSGTDVSIASADIVLMSDELERVLEAAELSRRTLRTIRQNIAISITYNLIMVPLAMAAVLTPLIAAVSMPISSLAVIGNSARIRAMFKGRRLL